MHTCFRAHTHTHINGILLHTFIYAHTYILHMHAYTLHIICTQYIYIHKIVYRHSYMCARTDIHTAYILHAHTFDHFKFFLLLFPINVLSFCAGVRCAKWMCLIASWRRTKPIKRWAKRWSETVAGRDTSPQPSLLLMWVHLGRIQKWCRGG